MDSKRKNIKKFVNNKALILIDCLIPPSMHKKDVINSY